MEKQANVVVYFYSMMNLTWICSLTLSLSRTLTHSHSLSAFLFVHLSPNNIGHSVWLNSDSRHSSQIYQLKLLEIYSRSEA